MKTPITIALLTVVCSVFPGTTSRACSAEFEFNHDTDYVYMLLPATLGVSTSFEWALGGADQDVDISGLPGIGESAELEVTGVAHLGPLLSLDATWHPDGSIGDADYVFGRGRFELALLFNLLDGTPHTMFIKGNTGRMYMSVQDDEGYQSGSFSMSIPKAKVDKKSAQLFGMKRKITGDVPYFTDVYNIDGSNDREVALFGSVTFNYTPVHAHHGQSLDVKAVPEPGMLALVGVGLVGVARRFRRS